ncbi:hypothetical protein [Methylobacterium aquaticum]|uniref:hypothetical protein n=1 Tax=Methylobacterium aquaticum TaxID=270351 RepID=UPI0019343253|nr:hypothetical protein [Methylobacterium aquaticum]QRE76983.1 hypothetical protein F1D61_28615 [Methylobacterium aquaticum]
MKHSEKPVSVLQAAREIGRSHTAVQNAIIAGRLTKCVVKDQAGKPKILLSLLRDEWATFTDKTGTMDGLRGGRPSKKAKPGPTEPPVIRIAPPESLPPARPFREEMPDHTPPDASGRVLYDQNGQAIMGFQASRALEGHYDVQLKELKYRL